MSMRLNTFLASVAGVVAIGATSANAQKVLVDVGTDNTWRGASVVNPDTNGNWWNSIDSNQFNTNMISTIGVGTGIDIGFSSLGGTDSYNGPLIDPGTGLGDPSLGPLGPGLGDLRLPGEAGFDYFLNTTFDIFGLDDTSPYELTFYGAHIFSAEDTTRYTIFSDNSATPSLLGTVDLRHQDPGTDGWVWVPNTNDVASITVMPGGGGTLTVNVAGLTGVEGYINAFSIEKVPAPGSLALLAMGGMLGVRRRR